MKNYQVDQNQINDYLISLEKRKNKVLLVAFVVLISVLLFSVISTDKLLSFFPISMAFFSIILMSALYFAFVRMYAKQKLQIESLFIGKYELDETSLKFLAPAPLARDFRFDEVAVIHKRPYGTIIIKGDSWTRMNYLRVTWGMYKSRNPYQFDSDNVIFIPNITSNYIEMIESIKQSAKNALKL